MLQQFRTPAIGTGLSFYYAAAQSLADGMSFGQAAHQQFESPAIGIAAGVVAGSVRFLSSYYFQGRVIRKYHRSEPLFADEETFSVVIIKDEEDDLTLPLLAKTKLTTKRCPKANDLPLHTFNYGYLFTRWGMEYFYNHFYYSSGKGWIQAFSEGRHVGVRKLLPIEIASILAFTVLFDLPFITTNEIYEACEGVADLLGKKVDPPFMSTLRHIFGRFPKYVSITGTLTSSLMHAIPLICIIDPQWILAAFAIHWMLVFLPAVLLTMTLGYLTYINIIQTYLFEGRHSESNLMQASGSDIKIEPFENRIIENRYEYEQWRQFYYWMATQGVFHAASDLWETIDTLEDYSTISIAYFVGIIIFIGSLLGVQYSEVLESRARMEKMLRNSPYYPYTNTARAAFFRPEKPADIERPIPRLQRQPLNQIRKA